MLEITIKHAGELTEQERAEVHETDHLAFSAPGIASNDDIEWSSAEWFLLGRFEGRVVATLAMLPREVRAGETRVAVVGIGGVATHPDYQRRGFGEEIMRRAAAFIRDEVKAPFGLLICSTDRLPYYAKFGWEEIDSPMYFDWRGEKRIWHEHTMVIALAGQPWPKGDVDLCGRPW